MVISVAGFCGAGAVAGAGASDFGGLASRLGGAVGAVVLRCVKSWDHVLRCG